MRLRVQNAPGMLARRFVVRCDALSVTRSRDVATLYANMTFDPAKINLQQVQYHCERGSRRATCVTTEVCFSYWVKSDGQAPHSTAGEPLSAAAAVGPEVIGRLSCRNPLRPVAGRFARQGQGLLHRPGRQERAQDQQEVQHPRQGDALPAGNLHDGGERPSQRCHGNPILALIKTESER